MGRGVGAYHRAECWRSRADQGGETLSTKTKKEIEAQCARNADVLTEACRLEFEKGTKGALLKAIAYCAIFETMLPPWVCSEFNAAYKKAVDDADASSWDEVFGTPHPTNAKRQQIKKREALREPVWFRVKQLRRTTPKPKDVFGCVGKEFNISAATAKRLFDAQQRWFKEAAEILNREVSGSEES